MLLAAAALAGPGREIVVSRGQLVEIGGGFRVPDVVAQAGATLVEVGTTNRTRRADYADAIGDRTGAILRAHPSNFRQLGFVQEVEIEELCELGVPVIDDVGSGNLAEDLAVLADEPPVRRSVRAGAALVCFSGDKLLGGPQAGLMVGRADAVAAAKQHPLARALRLDKLSLAALEATLRLYRDPTARRGPGAADAHRRRGDACGRAPSGWPTASARSSSRPPRSAAGRCRCSSCRARRSRSPATPRGSPRASGPPIRRWSAGSRTAASCSTPARSPTTRSSWSAPRSPVDARRQVRSDRRVPKYDSFGREIGEDTLEGLGGSPSEAPRLARVGVSGGHSRPRRSRAGPSPHRRSPRGPKPRAGAPDAVSGRRGAAPPARRPAQRHAPAGHRHRSGRRTVTVRRSGSAKGCLIALVVLLAVGAVAIGGVVSLVSSVGDSIDGVEKVIRAPEIGSVPDLNPGPKPTGLSKDSLMRRANVAAALRTLRSDENTKLTNLRLAPDRIDATLLTDEGRLRHVQIQPGGELERFGSDSGPGFDNVSTIPFAKLNPGAPQRLARRGAREHDVPISELQYAVPQDLSDGLRWVVYFTRGRYVIGNAAGRFERAYP